MIGVSTESWADAARNAVAVAAKSVRDLRIAEVVREDVTIENGAVSSYRVRLAISFKYETGDDRRLHRPVGEGHPRAGLQRVEIAGEQPAIRQRKSRAPTTSDRVTCGG